MVTKARTTMVWLMLVIIGLGGFCSVEAGQNLCDEQGWQLGMCAYSLRKFTFFEAVDKTSELGLNYIESFDWQRVSSDISVNMNHHLPDDVIGKIKDKLDSAGVKLVSHYYGALPADEAECRKIFAWAKKMGLRNFTSEPKPEAFDTIEKCCKEYGITVSIHNHPKGHSRYWHPDKVTEVCRGRSDLIGACGDAGHWQRSGIKPAEAVKILDDRLICMHMKDINKFGGGGHDVPWGKGKGELDFMLAELSKQNFEGLFLIEYEHHSENPMPEIRQCVSWFGRMSRALEPAGSPGATGAEVDMQEIDRLLEKISEYKYGKSREPVTELTDIIRDSYDSPEALRKIEARLVEFLQSDATLDSKQKICRRLSIIGTEQSAEVLGDMLTKPATSDMARYALERIPGEKIDKVLRAALENTAGKVRVGIINTIGERRDEKAVDELAKEAKSQDPMVSTAAMVALGKIGGERAARILDDVKSHVRPKEHRVWADAYLMCADSLLPGGKKDEAGDIYQQLYSEDEPLPIRIAALRGLMHVEGSDEAVKLISEVLKDDSRQMRSAAISLSKDIRGKAMTNSLAGVFGELSADKKVQLLAALGRRGDKAALSTVKQATNSKEERVRIAAIEALSMLGDGSTVELLANLAASKSGDEQEAAREALYRLRGYDVNQKILSSIKSSSDDVKIELIRSVGKRNMTEGADELLATAKSSGATVQRESLRVLREVGGKAQIEKLAQMLVDADDERQLKAVEGTLVAISLKSDATEAGTQAIRSRLDSVEDTAVKCSMLRVLGKLGEDDAIGVIKNALDSDDAEIKDTAIRVLAEWPNATPAETVIKLAKDAPKQTQRLLALRGYIRMIGLAAQEKSRDEVTKMYKAALDVAERPAEQKQVLAVMSKHPTVGALELVEPYLDDDEIKQEAKITYMAVATAVKSEHPDEAKAAYRKIQGVKETGPIVVKRGGETVASVLRGEISAPMEISADDKGVFYIVVPNGAQPPAEGDAGLAVYDFTAADSGTLSLEFYVNCPSGQDDSWFIKLDGTNYEAWNGLVTEGKWEWKQYPKEYEVKKGKCMLTIKHREDGAKMSKIKFKLE